MSSSSKLGRVSQNLAVAVLSLLLVGVVAEVFCRVLLPDRRIRYATDSELLFVLEPQQMALDADPPIQVRVNELGLRGPSLDSLAGRRALFLGDSFTFGSRVEERETFVARIDQAIQADVSAVNAGQPGYGFYQMAGIGRRLIPALEPEVVVVVIWEGLLLRQPLPDSERLQVLAKSEKIKRLKSLSVLGTHLYRAWERVALRLGANAAVVTLGHFPMGGEPLEQQFRAALESERRRLEDFAAWVEHSGGRLMLVLWSAEGFTESPMFPASEEVAIGLEMLARDLGVPYLNLKRQLSEWPRAKLAIAGDGHPTPFAHCLAAQSILAAFAQQGWYQPEEIFCETVSN